MKTSFNYKEDLLPAINAMTQSASTDAYVDASAPSAFKKTPQKRKRISNLHLWGEFSTAYKESMEYAVEAMVASAMNDKYADEKSPIL